MLDAKYLLTDDQMRQFITEGYLMFNVDLPEEYNKNLIRQLNMVYEKEGNPGNNLLPRLPELQCVFDNPKVKGALTSVLGEDYMMHAHRHGHYNRSSQPQGWKWHKDDYFGYNRIRDHKPFWAMIFYYPQDVTPEIGPTGLVPGSPFYDKWLYPDHPETEVTSVGKAGTVVLVHYDVWHRANPNVSVNDRYMLKFQFVRTQQPKSPSWNNRQKEWVRPEKFTQPVYEHDVLWENTWNWLTGNMPESDSSTAETGEGTEFDQLIGALDSDDESVRVQAANRLGVLGNPKAVTALTAALQDSFEPVVLNAAYGLSRLGSEGMVSLLNALDDDSALVAKKAAYGLTAAGVKAVDGLIMVLQGGTDKAKAYAAYALGHLHTVAPQAVPELGKLMDSDSEQVRRNAVEALGYFESNDSELVAAVAKGLKDAEVQVRFTSALTCARLGRNAAELADLLIETLQDENRYVRSYAAEALYYVKTEKAIDALLGFLKASRWCPVTTPESTY